jgi:hypothetical protein
MITTSAVMNELRREIGEDIVDVMPMKYFLDIIEDKTLITWSTYYPYIIRGVVITSKEGIPKQHPQTGRMLTYTYKIPKSDPTHEYINIQQAFYPGNNSYNQSQSSLPLMNSIQQMAMKTLPSANFFNIVRYSVLFVPPDICYIDPIPMSHIDFSLNMQRKAKLYEIPMYYRELFMNLAVCDCKLALYNKFKNLKDGATFQGLEISTSISDFGDAKSERKELLDMFRKDYMKDPNQFGAYFEYTSW